MLLSRAGRRLPWLLLTASACTRPEAPPTPPPPAQKLVWSRELPATSSLAFAQAARGLRVVRGIIHLHSVYSHDACDDNPNPGGRPNAPCLANLRRSLCQTRQDFAMLTDHASLMAATSFPELFLTDTAAGDEPEMAAGEVVASRLRCDDAVAPGHRVLLTVGGENALMPVGLHRHLGASEAERSQNMTADTPDAVRAFHAAGGLVLQAHGESRTPAHLQELAAAGLDGMEVYNLHANIDPRIRADYLGLEPLGAVAGLAPWLPARPVAEGGPEPDLSALGFLLENKNQLGKFDALLGLGYHLSPVLGSDIHENSFKMQLADGERGDSYRRLMRWFGNHLLVSKDKPLDEAQLHQALQRGRGYGVFHVFGEPVGFDFYAEGGQPAGGTAEMGDTVQVGAKLHLLAPRPMPDFDDSSAPALRLRVVRVAPGAAQSLEVQSRTASAAELRAGVALHVDTAAAGPGIYRAEVKVTPHYLLHLLGDDPELYRREYPYIYSGPIYVQP